jgi:hypothetical protein
VEIRNELKRIDGATTQSQRIKKQIWKEFVHQRDSSDFLAKKFVYQRDSTRFCFFCPAKLKVKFKCAPWNIWNVLDGASVQTDSPRVQTSNIEGGDTYICQLIRNKRTSRARLWFSPTEMAMDLPDDGQTLHIKLRQISHVFRRYYFHQATALEI